MSDNTTPPPGRARSKKPKTAPEMDLSAADVREIASEAPPEPATGQEPATGNAAETPPAETPVDTPADVETTAEAAAAEPVPVEAEPPPTPQAAPAPSPSKAVPAVLGLIAGLVGGVGGAALAPQLAPFMGGKAPAADTTLIERLTKTEAALSEITKQRATEKTEAGALAATLSGELASTRKALQALESRAASLGQPSPDIEGLRNRLGKLEGEAQVVPKEVGTLNSRVGAFQPKLDTLEKTVETLNSRVAAVGAKDALALANGRLAAQSLLEENFSTGKPYAETLDLIARTGGEPTLLALAKPFAETGAPSAKVLRDEGNALKPKPAAKPATDGGFLDRAKKAAMSLVEVRQVGDVAGKGDEAILARMDQSLAKGELNGAFAASAALSPALAPTYAPWRARLEARIKAGEAVVQLRKDAQTALARAAALTK
jgi:hypothetical protein